MNTKTCLVSVLILAFAGLLAAQTQDEKPGFESAARSVQDRLEQSLAELSALRERIATEKIPMAQDLGQLEAELTRVRQEFQQTTRMLDGRAQELVDLTGEIKKAREESSYLGKLFGDYIREFEAGLHIAERKRYEETLDRARLAAENDKLTAAEHFAIQVETLGVSVDRLDEILGGTIFRASAVDSQGLVQDGKIMLVGPAAIFRSIDGSRVGTVEQRVGSHEPAIVAFERPEDLASAEKLLGSDAAGGSFPLDPTLGNAHKMAATEETFIEHVKKGGPVMWPIFIMAGLGLIIAVFKWLSFTFIRKPSRRQVDALLEAVGRHDRGAAEELVSDLRGPVGAMLAAGVEHMREPRELIEEVMYENVLRTRLKLDRLLPFIAICAASAPLLGLLGTVTGIINTFKMITVFGSGDVKSLSGGISEALITTKFGLIVAIPSLLMHAFLSRKAKGVISQMEQAAVGFVNRVSKTPPKSAAIDDADEMPVPSGRIASRDEMKSQVREALKDILGPIGREGVAPANGRRRDDEKMGEAHA